MTSENKKPTLINPKGMGGIIAQDGFDYQIWYGLICLPSWLLNPSFEGIIFEGLEDVEAKFFTPYAPNDYLLDRFQIKSGELTKSKIKDIFLNFLDFEKSYPKSARVQVLVTPNLPSKLRWMNEHSKRVELARSFYNPFPEIIFESDQQLQSHFIEEFGQELGHFIFNHVGIRIKNISDKNSASALFASMMQQSFPNLSDVPVRFTTNSFYSLCELANNSKGEMIKKEKIVEILNNELETPLPIPTSLNLHIRSNLDEKTLDTVEIEASIFSGIDGNFPKSKEWKEHLLLPLNITAIWAQKHNRVKLSGRYRITTAFAIGYSFRSAIGFEIDIPTKDGLWQTDDYPVNTSNSTHEWNIIPPELIKDNTLNIAIGVIRDPSSDVCKYLKLSNTSSLLCLYLPKALLNGAHAHIHVQEAKNQISIIVQKHNIKKINLFQSTPAAFSVTLGHRWNALPTTQLYEFSPSKNSYIPTSEIP